jgi:hypothetical protein
MVVSFEVDLYSRRYIDANASTYATILDRIQCSVDNMRYTDYITWLTETIPCTVNVNSEHSVQYIESILFDEKDFILFLLKYDKHDKENIF